jgi:uncharacterized membrane protein YvbJ
VFCANCGSSILDLDNFCTNCGTKLRVFIEDLANKEKDQLVNDITNSGKNQKDILLTSRARREFTEQQKKDLQDPSFREALLNFEGGADTLLQAKAQGIF